MQEQPIIEENEIDYKAIALRLWAKRKFVLKIFAVFFVLGLLAAIFQTPKYTASCTFVNTSSSKGSSASLTSLAAMAGINLGDMSAGQNLSPLVYPQLLDNIELRKELMRVPLHFKGFDEPVSLLDLMTNPEYKRVTFSSVMGTVKKYTIGLPFTILAAIKGEPKDIVVPASDGSIPPVASYSNDEYKCSKALSIMLSMTVEKKEGYLTLTANYKEKIACAELCQAAFSLVSRYVSEYKVQNAVKSERYIRGRYEEAKSDYEEKQITLARFVDANKGRMTATAQVKRDQLLSDYNLSYALYTEISKQLLQAEMKVKEDTPVLCAVRPVSVPMKKSNSRSKTMMGWIFFGVVVSCGSVLAFDWLKKKGVNWPKNWE